jgi:DNA-binding transcriptional MerR regulator
VQEQGFDPGRGVYGISVASELVGLGPQTLRQYEQRGLLEPARTEGGTRLYSDDDLERLRRIADLLGEGLNLAGVAMVLDLERANDRLLADNTRIRADTTRMRADRRKRGRGAPG